MRVKDAKVGLRVGTDHPITAGTITAVFRDGRTTWARIRLDNGLIVDLPLMSLRMLNANRDEEARDRAQQQSIDNRIAAEVDRQREDGR